MHVNEGGQANIGNVRPRLRARPPSAILDQADDAPVADPVLQEADQPIMTDLIEKRPDVGVQYEAHLLAAGVSPGSGASA